jgi:hypothetical protein
MGVHREWRGENPDRKQVSGRLFRWRREGARCDAVRRRRRPAHGQRPVSRPRHPARRRHAAAKGEGKAEGLGSGPIKWTRGGRRSDEVYMLGAAARLNWLVEIQFLASSALARFWRGGLGPYPGPAVLLDTAWTHNPVRAPSTGLAGGLDPRLRGYVEPAGASPVSRIALIPSGAIRSSKGLAGRSAFNVDATPARPVSTLASLSACAPGRVRTSLTALAGFHGTMAADMGGRARRGRGPRRSARPQLVNKSTGRVSARLQPVDKFTGRASARPQRVDKSTGQGAWGLPSPFRLLIPFCPVVIRIGAYKCFGDQVKIIWVQTVIFCQSYS